MNIRRVAWSLLVLILLAGTSWAQIGRTRIGPPRWTSPTRPIFGDPFGPLNNGLRDITLRPPLTTLRPIESIELKKQPELVLDSPPGVIVEAEPSPGVIVEDGYSAPTSPPPVWQPPVPPAAPSTPSHQPTFQPPVNDGGPPPVEEPLPPVVAPPQDEEETVNVGDFNEEVDTLVDAAASVEEEDNDEASGEWTWFGRIGVGLGVLCALGFIGAVMEDLGF